VKKFVMPFAYLSVAVQILNYLATCHFFWLMLIFCIRWSSSSEMNKVGGVLTPAFVIISL